MTAKRRIVTSDFGIIVLACDEVIMDTLHNLFHRLEGRSESFQRVQLLSLVEVTEVSPLDVSPSFRGWS